MTSDLLTAGRRVNVSGNVPLDLTSRDGVWFVLEGSVQLFLITGDDGEQTRHHLATFEAGSSICGFAVDPSQGDMEASLLAVGVGTTVLIDVTPGDFARLPVDRAAFIEGWIRTMGRAVAEGWPAPVLDQFLRPGEPTVLGDRQRAAPSKFNVVWVETSSGGARLLGFRDLPIQGLFPLSEDLWIETTGNTTLVAHPTAAAVGGEAVWPALRAFQSAILACAAFHRTAAQVGDVARAEERERTDRTLHSAALQQLADVLSVGGPGESVRPRSSVEAAAAVVAGIMGFSIRNDWCGAGFQPASRVKGRLEACTTPIHSRPVGEALLEIGRNAGVRVRKVLLRDQWWSADHGPLVGQLDSDLRPVALVRKGGRYVVHDVANNVVFPVDRGSARRISPHAFCLFRPLPNRPLGIRDLLRFGSHGTAADLRRLGFATVAWTLTGLIAPVIAGAILDSVVPDRDVALLVQLTLLLVAVAFASAMFDLVRRLAYLRLETRIAISMQPAVWDRLLSLPIRFFRRFSAGELAMRANAIDEMRRTLTGVTASAIVGGVFAAFTLILLFWYSAALAGWAALLGATVSLATVAAGIAKVRFQTRVVDLRAKLAGLVLQMLGGIAKIRVAGAESRASAVWATAFAAEKHFGVRAGRVDARLKSFNVLFSALATVVIFWLFLRVVGGPGGLSVGDLVASQFAFASFIAAMMQMSLAAVQAIAVVPLLRNARPILEVLPESAGERGLPPSVSGTVDVSHVSFRYEDDPRLVLDDVSIHADARELVALVGPSGGGKSTLLRLLLGFETPESGAVYYDGRSLANLDPRQVRRNIGVVLQNGRIMAGDILTNIIGSSPLTLDEAWDAARMAGLADDIRNMPMGMHTVLPEGATTLSGGQRQRLLIARALVLRPKLLLFDEATSALDNRTQEFIDEGLARLNVTRIVIAHRLSTVRNADRIYVMSGGRIVESGSCSDLMRNDGPFARLVERQSLEARQ